MMDFIVDNYYIIIVVAAFLIFALIGYIVDTLKNKNKVETTETENDNIETDIIEEKIVDEETEEKTNDNVNITVPESTENQEIIIPEVENEEDNK